MYRIIALYAAGSPHPVLDLGVQDLQGQLEARQVDA